MNEDKYYNQRLVLINTLKTKGIIDKKVLDVMLKVPRHEFMEKTIFTNPYEDAPQSIGEGQTISQPYIVALMTEYLNLSGEEKVLEVGTGCGYQTAILCELAKEVYSLERIEKLHYKATKNLNKMGYTNVYLKLSDGTEGLPEYAPYNAIIVTAAAPEVPLPLKEQLTIGGRLVIPVGKASPQELICITRNTDNFQVEYICGVYFVPLIGKHGWKN